MIDREMTMSEYLDEIERVQELTAVETLDVLDQTIADGERETEDGSIERTEIIDPTALVPLAPLTPPVGPRVVVDHEAPDADTRLAKAVESATPDSQIIFGSFAIGIAAGPTFLDRSSYGMIARARGIAPSAPQVELLADITKALSKSPIKDWSDLTEERPILKGQASGAADFARRSRVQGNAPLDDILEEIRQPNDLTPPLALPEPTEPTP